MNDQPPKIPQPPPIIPKLPIPSPQKRNRLTWPVKLILVAVVAFVCFFAFRLVQFASYLREHPRQVSAGEAAFRDANRQIISGRGAAAFGNNPEAVSLAEEYSRSLKILREGFFTEGKANAISISKGRFLTYCQWNGDSCVFLVHVPELRRFTADAKKTLAELAWINAQSVVKAKTLHPPKTVAVGVKGAVLYETILIGDFVSDPQGEGDGIKTRTSGIDGLKLFYPFFVPPKERAITDEPQTLPNAPEIPQTNPPTNGFQTPK